MIVIIGPLGKAAIFLLCSAFYGVVIAALIAIVFRSARRI